MRTRRLGRTGLQVSEVGFGAWGIGGAQWLGAEDQESLRALHRAMELGVTFVDTALAYGRGHSERLVGQAVREHGGGVTVATKVPPANLVWPAPAGLDPDEAFPAAHVRRCAEKSLRNLGTDAIDLLQLHVWSDEWIGRGGWAEEVQALRDEGLVRAFGISINDNEPQNGIALVRSGVVDSVQVIYNVFEQAPADELFGVCAEHDVGVIARVPFDEGALTGAIGPDTTFPEGDFREGYFRGDRRQQVAEHVDALVADLGIERDALADVALRFTLAHPAVSTVIPGMRSLRNVERNARVGDADPLTEEQLAVLRRHRWERNFYR